MTKEKKNILAVDDEPGILKILRIQLGLDGCEVTTTTSGREAIEIVRQREPDAILLDLLMPDINGLEVIKKVRSFSKVPIIAFTANSHLIDSALKAGADGAIQKPFDPGRVLEKINNILKAKALESPRRVT